MKTLLISMILSLTLLAGCENLPKNKTGQITEKEVKIDPKVLQLCAELQKASIVTADDLAIENISLYEAYGLCSKKQRDSVLIIKKLANIKE